ncbi:MAG: hypothetical protein QM687_09940 [Ferruginibacter sp.]
MKKLTTMTRGQKTGALLLAGLAAFAIYKISKMSGEDRTKLAGDIQDKGRQLLDNLNPRNIKNKFSHAANNVYENSQS